MLLLLVSGIDLPTQYYPRYPPGRTILFVTGRPGALVPHDKTFAPHDLLDTYHQVLPLNSAVGGDLAGPPCPRAPVLGG